MVACWDLPLIALEILSREAPANTIGISGYVCSMNGAGQLEEAIQLIFRA
jgi:hypothetical protein